MTKDELFNLTVGIWIYDRESMTYGEVKFGKWTSLGIWSTIRGEGKYIRWDDGDNSCIGIEHLRNFEQYEISDIIPT